MRKLGVELILAHSPQAKGRVERMNGVLQDRLVKAACAWKGSTIWRGPTSIWPGRICANTTGAMELPAGPTRIKARPKGSRRF